MRSFHFAAADSESRRPGPLCADRSGEANRSEAGGIEQRAEFECMRHTSRRPATLTRPVHACPVQIPPGAMAFMGFAAEASDVLPDEAYHARVAREEADRGGYAFNAAAFPQLFDLDACARATIDLDRLTPLTLNQQAGSRAAARADDSCSSSSCGSLAPPPAAATSSHVSNSPAGLELTMHESHTGNLIGSVVWEGGRVLAWVLETMHDTVRELKPDGSGFIETPQFDDAHSASSFTSPAYSEYLRAQAAGACFDLPRNFLVGARVLELGAGTGITGLACVKLGAAHVVLTDIETLKPLMAENVRRNCPGTLRNSEEWRPTTRTIANALVAPATAATVPVAAIDPVAAPADVALPLSSSVASSPAAPSAAASSSSSAAAPSFEYESCSNCDDLTVGLLRCSICDVSLCDLCDASWHRPANKSAHQRTIGGIFAEGATAASSSATSSCSSAVAPSAASMQPEASAAAAVTPAASLAAAAAAAAAAAPSPAAAPCYVLPSHCDVYVEELLWGEQSSLSALPLSLRAPFDVIVMADVVYDAYSVTGPGSEDCDNFRRLFATLCLLVPEGSNTTVLLTYTPRRAPERVFFELLATAFLWCTYPATSLLPSHEEGSVDDRIWIYHLHRSRMAGRVKQQAYIHQNAYGSDLSVERRNEQERRERRRKMEGTQLASSSSSSSSSSLPPPPPIYVSASAIPAVRPAPPRRPDSPPADSDATAASAAPVNITPTLTRHLENEEERQQAQLRAKLQRRATKHNNDAELDSRRSAPPQTDAAHL